MYLSRVYIYMYVNEPEIKEPVRLPVLQLQARDTERKSQMAINCWKKVDQKMDMAKRYCRERGREGDTEQFFCRMSVYPFGLFIYRIIILIKKNKMKKASEK